MKYAVSDIYELNPEVEDPRFEGFALTNSPSVLGRDSLDDDLTPGFADAEQNPRWEQPSLVAHWVPPKVIGRVSEFNDYPCVNLVFPAFSQRAVDGLQPLLSSNGELLPLNSDGENHSGTQHLRRAAIGQMLYKIAKLDSQSSEAEAQAVAIKNSWSPTRGHCIFWDVPVKS